MNSKKKVLVLGGKPIGSVELVQKLKEKDLYVIVTDYLPLDDSPAKRIADEAWDISTAEVDLLSRRIIDENISAIMTGVHEFNINRMLDICEKTSLPTYCTKETWKYCDNKGDFKELCIKNSIPVAKTYSLEQILQNQGVTYPLIVKPIDGSGSRGFHVCENADEVKKYYKLATQFSPSGHVLIEQFIPYDAVIIHYTMIKGKCYYSGMSDKISVKFKSTGASVMGIQTFPSKGETSYLESLNDQALKMFESAGFTDGPIWIEAFYDGENTFIFNEMGYRFGGSLTYYPVRYFTGIDQMELMIDNALGNKTKAEDINVSIPGKNYCILPLHIKAGKIISVQFDENLEDSADLQALVPVHFEGDTIQNWGSAQQVYAYAHLLYTDKADLVDKVENLLKGVRVIDENDNNMIYTLFDVNSIKI